ncbi:MAG: 2-phospho-L-lactate guanylyltransferase [bacterium]|nr:2-phospho-L-lactate guanylyltransferase [bacterium]
MTRWAAITPWKQGPDTKSRLSAMLDETERMTLASAMAGTVLTCLSQVEAIGSLHLLAPTAVPAWPCQWLPDEGRGLNGELDAARLHWGKRPIVIIHADLPCLTVDDVECLLAAAAASGAAFAPDRHGRGTNAVALADSADFRFAIGPDSFANHRGQRPDAAIIARVGLSFDVDTPADLDQWRAMPGVQPLCRACAR